MEYRFGEWIFDPEYLFLYKSSCAKDVLFQARDILAGQRKRYIIDELLKDEPCSEEADILPWNPIGICPTYCCNLKCKYCGYSSKADNSAPVSISMVETFLNDVVKRYLISKRLRAIDNPLVLFISGGGEPSYEWGLLKNIICYFRNLCKMHGIKEYINVTTNGILNNAQIDFMSENIQEIMVSYDGLPNLQNGNRPTAYGKSTNRAVENTIKRFSAANIKLTVRSTIWPDDYNRLYDMYSHILSIIENKEFFSWSVNPVAYEGRATEYEQQLHVPEKSFVSYYLDFLERILRENGEDEVKRIGTPFITNDYSRLYCGALNGRQPWLLPNGDIVMCLESPNYENIIAHVEKERIYYNRQGDINITPTIKMQVKKCQGCIAVGFCNGGCPVWFMRRKSSDAEPVECLAQREYCHRLIRALINGTYSWGWQLNPIPGFDNDAMLIMTKQ